MNASEVLKLFADPAIIKTLQWQDLTTGILITLFLGMGVTFIVLIILQMATIGLSRVLAAETAAAKPEVPDTAQYLPGRASAITVDDELAAVITSAVAAVMGKSADKIVIKSVKQV
jgi:sodium pump decarboxylase gamma subunit